MAPKIAIYVQHLMGAGHLVRAMALANALAEAGNKVLLISGGFAIDREVLGYHYYQLPPTRAMEGDFTHLVDADGAAINDAWRRTRANLLLNAVSNFAPDAMITETFPFGRRQFRFELEPLIQWVKSQQDITLLCSIRDVLQRRSPEKNLATVATIQQYYDHVLVHADESLFSLNASFDLSEQIKDKLVYTAYIYQAMNQINIPKDNTGCDEIIVSGGSGSVSANLLDLARQARPLSIAKHKVWRLLTGSNTLASVKAQEAGLIIEPNRADFFALLSRCALSISQAGYNTSLDILLSGARSLMVPFVGDGETEQRDRAQALARAGRVSLIFESGLTPKRLARAIDSALEMTPLEISVNTNGAATSVRIISALLSRS